MGDVVFEDGGHVFLERISVCDDDDGAGAGVGAVAAGSIAGGRTSGKLPEL